MIMHKSLYFISLMLCPCSFYAATPQKSSKIIPITTTQDRQKWIQFCEDFIADKNLVDQVDIENLFEYKKEPIQEKIETPAPDVEKNPATTNELIVLKSVGMALHPSGNVMMNGQYILCIQNAKTLKEGDVLEASYYGEKYRIQIKSISKNKFILQLNNYALTFNY